MKKLTLISLFLIAATILSAKTNNKNSASTYSFNSIDLDGNEISSELYSNNKITMVNIWGTFCGPCIREMPDLAKLSQEYKSKGVEIIGIPIDIADDSGKIDSSLKDDALMIIEKTGVQYKNVVPTIDMFRTFLSEIQAVPTTIFIDKNGNQIGKIYLGSRSQKDWQKILDKLLENQK